MRRPSVAAAVAEAAVEARVGMGAAAAAMAVMVADIGIIAATARMAATAVHTKAARVVIAVRAEKAARVAVIRTRVIRPRAIMAIVTMEIGIATEVAANVMKPVTMGNRPTTQIRISGWLRRTMRSAAGIAIEECATRVIGIVTRE